MVWFRKRRIDLGRYVGPESFPVVPIADVVEEGVLIAASAARLAMRNQAVVRILRDREDVDLDWYVAAGREQLALFAEEKAGDVARVEAEIRAWSRPRRPEKEEGERLERRHQMLIGLVDRLAELAADEAYMNALARTTRDAVVDEMRGAITFAALRSTAPDVAEGDERDAAITSLEEELRGLRADS